jgi:hypothetical protein
MVSAADPYGRNFGFLDRPYQQAAFVNALAAQRGSSAVELLGWRQRLVCVCEREREREREREDSEIGR